MLDVSGNKLTITRTAVITSGSENVDMCMFTFDNEWQGFTKIAVFSTADGDEYTELIVNNSCNIPSECLKKNGLLRIGVAGKDNGTKIMSTNLVSHRVVSGANENGAAQYSEATFSQSGSNAEYGSAAEDIRFDSGSEELSIDNTGFTLDDLCVLYPGYACRSAYADSFAYYDFKQSGYSKTVALKYDLSFIADAAADFISRLCASSGSGGTMGNIYSSVRFIIFSGENYEDFFSENEIKNLVFAADFSLKNLGGISKKIMISKTCNEKPLINSAESFDEIYDETGTTVLIKTEDDFTDFFGSELNAASCGIEWNANDLNAEKFADFFRRMIIPQIYCGEILAPGFTKSFSKHILWRSDSPDDTLLLDGDMKTMWLSLYRTDLDAFYDITMSGYAIVRSHSGAKVVVRPVLYQENVDKQNRFADCAFDTECDIMPGVSSVAINSVIYGNYSCEGGDDTTYPSKLGAVLRAKAVQGDAEIIGFSYTVSGVESDGRRTEILIPQGLVSDYESEENPPVFMVKTYETGEEENE